MVDNENKWEDIEYSDSSDPMDQGFDEEFEEGFEEEFSSDSGYENDSYSNDSYDYDSSQQGADEEYSDEMYDETDDDYKPQKSSSGGAFFVLLLLILLIVGGYFYFKNRGESVEVKNDNVEVSVQQPSEDMSTEDMAVAFFAAAGGDSDFMSIDFNDKANTSVAVENENNTPVSTVSDVKNEESEPQLDLFETTENLGIIGESEDVVSEENNAIMVVYNKAARLNPFKPPILDKTQMQDYDLVNNTEFEIIEPPTSSEPDENLTKLLQTQISGILYDEESPSAIVNLNGMDQFVKTGDVISGYKIDSITKNQVQISYNNNSYVASVGELFTRGRLEKQQAIVNLENKFAGRYKNKKIEE